LFGKIILETFIEYIVLANLCNFLIWQITVCKFTNPFSQSWLLININVILYYSMSMTLSLCSCMCITYTKTLILLILSFS